MGKIIAFNVGRRNGKTQLEAERWKAIAKGNIETYSCDMCGADIEVINGKFPDKCPGCGLSILHWNDTEENL